MNEDSWMDREKQTVMERKQKQEEQLIRNNLTRLFYCVERAVSGRPLGDLRKYSRRSKGWRFWRRNA